MEFDCEDCEFGVPMRPMRGVALSGWIRTIVLVGLSWGGICGAGVTDYAVTPGSPQDAAACAWQGQDLTVKITSATGIGRVELAAKGRAPWPKVVRLSIRTKDGKPLRELEGLTVSGKRLRINGSRRTSGRMDCHEIDPGNPKIRKNARQVHVVVTQGRVAMEITIPGSLLKGERKVKIQWVDFYR